VDIIEVLFRNGHIADLVIAFMVIEALALVVVARSGATSWSLGVMLAGLLPGLFLVLALRAALVQASSLWIAGALSGALLAHLLDLRLRVAASSQR